MPSQIPEVPMTGVWYRHVPAGAPPMPGQPPPDGRWQRGEQFAGLYLAEDPETVWAERYRGSPSSASRPTSVSHATCGGSRCTCNESPTCQAERR